MIIVLLLLFFQSVCLYCQHLVLNIYDRWINPKNSRALKGSTNSKIEIRSKNTTNTVVTESVKTLCHSIVTNLIGFSAGGNKLYEHKRGTHKLKPQTSIISEIESCRFCAHTPQGYCRHHFHLQELRVQQQKCRQFTWNPFGTTTLSAKQPEYRELRKINRELKRNLKNRLETFSQRALITKHQQACLRNNQILQDHCDMQTKNLTKDKLSLKESNIYETPIITQSRCSNHSLSSTSLFSSTDQTILLQKARLNISCRTTHL